MYSVTGIAAVGGGALKGRGGPQTGEGQTFFVRSQLRGTSHFSVSKKLLRVASIKVEISIC